MAAASAASALAAVATRTAWTALAAVFVAVEAGLGDLLFGELIAGVWKDRRDARHAEAVFGIDVIALGDDSLLR